MLQTKLLMMLESMNIINLVNGNVGLYDNLVIVYAGLYHNATDLVNDLDVDDGGVYV